MSRGIGIESGCCGTSGAPDCFTNVEYSGHNTLTIPRTVKGALKGRQDVIFHKKRLLYIDHESQTSCLLPPKFAWECLHYMPYGWEIGELASLDRIYYINHKEQSTTFEDPRLDYSICTSDENPCVSSSGEISDEANKTFYVPREVELTRDNVIGFGFVAGSEKPVVVRYVTTGGPSEQILFPGDQILKINGTDARDLEKFEVVQLVRASPDRMTMVVCQSEFSNHNIKPVGCSTAGMPNILRVFLENGQTKSFKYDECTTVEDVILSLKDKLGINAVEHFGLVLEYVQGTRTRRLILLDPCETIHSIAGRPGSHQTKCLLRVVFVPANIVWLSECDPISFEYFYQQCVRDVISGRLLHEMRYEACLRLAALHIQQCIVDNHYFIEKVSLKFVEKQYGYHVFLPQILLQNVRKKEIRKHIRHYMKRDIAQRNIQSSIGNYYYFSSQDSQHKPYEVTQSYSVPFDDRNVALMKVPDQIRAKYIHLLSHLPSFGGKSFYVINVEEGADMVLTISARHGLSLRNVGRCAQPIFTVFFTLITALAVSLDKNESQKQLSVHLDSDEEKVVNLLVDKEDVEEIVLLIRGYCNLHTNNVLDVYWEDKIDAPVYSGIHYVKPSIWNYGVYSLKFAEEAKFEVDLATFPPKYSEVVHEIPIAVEKRPIRYHTARNRPLFVSMNNDKMAISSSEKQLLPRYYCVEKPPSPSVHVPVSGAIRDQLERINSLEGNLSSVSESETDSQTTPSESPLKSVNEASKPDSLTIANSTSFGLRSPDTIVAQEQMLTDSTLNEILNGFSSDKPQFQEFLKMFPDNCCTDKDITDLAKLQENGLSENLSTPVEIASKAASPTSSVASAATLNAGSADNSYYQAVWNGKMPSPTARTARDGIQGSTRIFTTNTAATTSYATAGDACSVCESQVLPNFSSTSPRETFANQIKTRSHQPTTKEPDLPEPDLPSLSNTQNTMSVMNGSSSTCLSLEDVESEILELQYRNRPQTIIADILLDIQTFKSDLLGILETLPPRSPRKFVLEPKLANDLAVYTQDIATLAKMIVKQVRFDRVHLL